jgi:hypothetical protein
MSFYLEDYPDEDQTELCPHCGGRDFYSDPISGTLTCSSCYTQSQSQHEEIDIDEGLGLAAMSGKRTKTAAVKGINGGKGGKAARDLRDYDSSRQLPDVESCCLAFQWLLSDASKYVVKLSGMNEQHANKYPDHYQEELSPSILELTVKQIWFAYLHKWTKSAQCYSKRYPEMRVSFRDLFLSDTRRSVIVRHLSVTIGKRIEKEMIQDMQMKLQSKDGEKIHDQMSTSSSEDTDKAIIARADTSASKNRKPIISVPQLCSQVLSSQRTRDRHRLPNGCYEIDPFTAAIQIQPSLTLLLSILQLALIHLKTGHVAYHLTSWVANGYLPHALNGYALLPADMKDRVVMVKKFFVRSFVPPADAVDDLAFLLAASIGWLGDAILEVKETPIARKRGSERKRKLRSKPQTKQLVSVYNVPLLAGRMVQDLGFNQKVVDNALALMGLQPKSSTKEKKPNSNATISLKVASPSNLYTPLHVAAVLVVACKLCQGWEDWIISIHSSENSQCIPWNNSQLQQLGNGTALDKYIDFLQDTALNELNSSCDVSQFFQRMNDNMESQSENKRVPLKTNLPSVTPNTALAGVPNPTEQPKDQMNTSFTQKTRYYIAHKKQKKKAGKTTSASLHSSYRRLIEYICYTIEETKPAKLHNLVLDLEAELKRIKRSG